MDFYALCSWFFSVKGGESIKIHRTSGIQSRGGVDWRGWLTLQTWAKV